MSIFLLFVEAVLECRSLGLIRFDDGIHGSFLCCGDCVVFLGKLCASLPGAALGLVLWPVCALARYRTATRCVSVFLKHRKGLLKANSLPCDAASTTFAQVRQAVMSIVLYAEQTGEFGTR